MAKTKKRCIWCLGHDIYEKYHDEDWGVPVHDDQKLFEMLTLEGAQAGLSWLTILNKREGYRTLFSNFDIQKVSRFSQKKIDTLLLNPAIVRNKLKVHSTITNAKAFIQVQKEFGSFDQYIWQFVGGKPIRNSFKSMREIPAKTPISDIMSKDLKKRGFKFVGSTICYAFMQATGMVNDHQTDCFRYKQV